MSGATAIFALYAGGGGIILPLIGAIVGFSKRRLPFSVACVACAVLCFVVMDSSPTNNIVIDAELPPVLVLILSLIMPLLSIAVSVKTFKAESQKVEKRDLDAAVDRKISARESDMKKCLYCAETIQQDAIYCRYCGKNIDQPN